MSGEAKMSEKVTARTWTLQTIKESIDPEKEIVIVVEDYVRIDDIEPPHRLKMLFKKAGNRYVEINISETIRFIADKLKPHVDVSQFLVEHIRAFSSAEEIMELKERLEKGPVKVSGKPLCYSLMVGGKRGRPYEFNLVG